METDINKKTPQEEHDLCYCEALLLDKNTLFLYIKKRMHASERYVFKITSSINSHGYLENFEFVEQLSPKPDTTENYYELNSSFKDRSEFIKTEFTSKENTFYLSITEMKKLFDFVP